MSVKIGFLFKKSHELIAVVATSFTTQPHDYSYFLHSRIDDLVPLAIIMMLILIIVVIIIKVV